MGEAHSATGYGTSQGYLGKYGRLIFDGDERKYEQWEVKLLGYMKLRKLKDIITKKEEGVEDVTFTAKNEEAYAELIQFLDDKSLSLIMRDAADDGRGALKILRAHYAGTSKPRIISLYTELTSLAKQPNESVTDYIIRAETAVAALKNAEEAVSDSLLIAMALKGLPENYKSFVVVITQSDKKHTFCEFKEALRSFEDTERARTETRDDSIMKTVNSQEYNKGTNITCYSCGQSGHIAPRCPKKQGIICHACGQPGHIAPRCRNKKRWCGSCKSSSHNESNCRRKKEKSNENNKDKCNQLTDTTDDSNKDIEHSFAFEAKVSSNEINNAGPNMLLVDCGATAHIITDESKFINFDESFRPEKHFIELANGTKCNNVAHKRGDVNVSILDENGRHVSTLLKNALYIPSFPQDIFSVQAAIERGASITFQPDAAELVHKNGRKFNIVKHGRLYYLKTCDNKLTSDSVNYACNLKGWHKILGHCNYDDVKKLESLVVGMKVTDKTCKPDDCDVCTMGKMTQGRNRGPRVRSNAPLELVHTDLTGPIDPISTEGFRYAVTFTDDYSGAIFVYFLKHKSDTLAATEKFLADCAPFGNVLSLRSDNGSEFTSRAFQSFLIKNRIKHETSAPYSPHQNGTAERQFRTLFEMGRCLLMEAKLDKEWWPYAVMAAAYTRNRCYNKRIDETPYFAITGRKPDVSNMRVFGCECYVYNCKPGMQKLDSRCRKGVFMGYDRGSPAYLVYIPKTGKVVKCRVVKFPTMTIKTDFEKPIQTLPSCDDDDDDFGRENPELEGDLEPGNQAGAEVGDRNARYPRRERNPPLYLGDYVTNVEDGTHVMSSIDYCYRISDFPQSYKEAIESTKSEQWKSAMREEMNSLKINDTFTLVDLPEGRNAVGGRWVYTIKENSNGSQTYKARFVAKGYSQVEGVDYKETFAPTANLTSMRVLMQEAAQYDLILHQMDVKTAYLNAPIDCEIYMDQAEGFVAPSEGKLVYKLNKSLYGLKQSGRNWNGVLHSYLLENDFIQSRVDHCLYLKQMKSEIVIILVWVDDLIIGASNENLLCEVKQMLQAKFSMKDLGALSYFLGIDFEQDVGSVKMNQKRYLRKILERFEMNDCKPRYTPCEQNLEFNDEDPVDCRKYREVIGSLIYAMTCTRPDICWIVTKLSQYLSKPVKAHWVTVKHVLRYLKGTIDYELCYRKSEDGLNLVGYSDADWASSIEDRRSTTGYCFSLSKTGPLISWKSRKQPTVALSSCEAEYIALAAAIQEILHLTQLLNDIDRESRFDPVTLFEDNQGTIALAKNPINRQRSKHIDIRYHFIRNEISSGKVVLQYCPTQDMVADIMTKPATKIKLEKFGNFLFGQ